MKHNDLIHEYEVDVEFPDVSGIEHLDMFLTRSEIAAIEHELTEEQRQRLYHADQLLIEQAQQFYEAIQQILNVVTQYLQQNHSYDKTLFFQQLASL